MNENELKVNEEIKDDQNNIDGKVNKDKAKKKIGIFLIIIVIIGLLYWAYFNFYGSHFQKTENAYVTGNQVAVTAQIGGSITSIHFKNTSIVKKGDLLLEIEDTDYKLALEGAEINLAQAVRNYSALKTSVKQYKQALRVAQNVAANARKIYNRTKRSYDAGLISKQSLDQAYTSYSNANLNVTLKRQAYNNARLQASSKSVHNHPAVRAAILKYKKAFLDLSRTKIYAPTDGTIAKKSISIGQKVGNGYPLFSIIDLNKEWVEVNLKENQVKDLKVGNEVELVSSLNGKEYKGYVVGISAGTGNAFSLLPAQNATGNWIKITQRVPVRVMIDEKDLEYQGSLPLGTTMEATINTQLMKYELPVEEPSISTPYKLDMKKIDTTVNKIIKDNLY